MHDGGTPNQVSGDRSRERVTPLRVILFVLTLCIGLGWITVGLLYLRGRLALGHWPSGEGPDDPKDLELAQGLHFELTGYAVFACVAGTLGMFGAFVAARTRGPRPSWIWPYEVAAIISTALYFGTPWISWYLD